MLRYQFPMVKRLLFVFFWLACLGDALASGQTDSVLRRLEEVMADRAAYDAKKEQQLPTLSRMAQRRSLSPAEQYEAHLQLIEAYQK